MSIGIFRNDLTDEERAGMKAWARANYEVLSPIQGIWHPEVQAECVRMNEEHGLEPLGKGRGCQDDSCDARHCPRCGGHKLDFYAEGLCEECKIAEVEVQS